MTPRAIAFAALCLLAACGGSNDATPEPASANLLLVILDDVGLDAVGCYGAPEDDVRTPVLDGLAASGARFETVWANPWCSPTRATILSGLYGFRTGVGAVLDWDDDWPGLGTEFELLPQAITADRGGRDVRSAMIGKWHLGTKSNGLDHPRDHGFERFRGTVGNLGRHDETLAYFDYEEVANGEAKRRQEYATTAVVDDALEAIRSSGADPWFVVVSFHAAHMPFHDPPAELCAAERDRTQSTPRAQFLSMVEALDHELGRLLDGLAPEDRARTHVVVVGDNGTPKPALPDGIPFEHGKGSLYEPGVRVPLIVTGPAVEAAGVERGQLVNTTDVFATCVELMTGRATPDATDSVSFVATLRDPDAAHRRAWLFAERYRPGDRTRSGTPIDRVAARDGRFKRIENRVRGRTELYDLTVDPGEERDLWPSRDTLPAEAREAFDALGRMVVTELGR
ncbi:MAG: sulfatase-like hydrolase/transferase [Planctomycetota bacterium]